jgi:hypothetical protein
MTPKKVTVVIANIILLILLFVFLLISPYAYEWDETLKQIDCDKLLVLKMFWLLSSFTTVGIAILHHPTRKYLYIYYGIIFALSIYKTVSLFLLR